ncbi:hypothetical protein E2562_036963 [Oryza meyeriana var. granulata]|uniref:Uncharacterized protein n=1 Tax=Oryza meyeriana var. granulata TaxID=110450 RepID=A0A6G1ETH5_9ORYZ|nr:hypothetical protein E2562_036963 [Oryza meyeriana var. granulata]
MGEFLMLRCGNGSPATCARERHDHDPEKQPQVVPPRCAACRRRDLVQHRVLTPPMIRPHQPKQGKLLLLLQ